MANIEVSIFPGGGKGYGEAGASHTKRSVKGFRAESGSPREDIDANNSTLRQRSRMLYMSSPIAASGIKTNRTNTIGLGLKLNPKIDWKYLGITQEQAEEWEKDTKAEFRLWSKRKNACDATGMNSFEEIQQLAFISWLVSGDVFVLLKHTKRDKDRPYSLRLHVIEADRCSTPQKNVSYLFNMTQGKTDDGNRIYDGVEVDKEGKAIAYHFRNTYPYEAIVEETKWERVEAYGEKTGLPNVIHIMNSERPEQYRGVSYLAQIIEPILQLRRYTEAEITAAVVNSFFTAFIKTTRDTNQLPFDSTSPKDDEQGEGQGRYNPEEYKMGAGQVNVMNPDEDVVLAEPKHPVAGFGEFVEEICTQIGAALEIPKDLVMKKFGNSYSASRAALLEAWKMFRMYRGWFVSDFCMPAYEVWISEAVALGRVNAPGFFGDRRTKEAWMGAEWVGPSQGQLDPGKEIKAEILAVEHGFSTHEDSTVRLNGGDWNANMDKLRTENAKKEGAARGGGSSPKGKEGGEDIRNIIEGTIRGCLKEMLKEMAEEGNRDGEEK